MSGRLAPFAAALGLYLVARRAAFPHPVREDALTPAHLAEQSKIAEMSMIPRNSVSIAAPAAKVPIQPPRWSRSDRAAARAHAHHAGA